jgi:hypothetical protein
MTKTATSDDAIRTLTLALIEKLKERRVEVAAGRGGVLASDAILGWENTALALKHLEDGSYIVVPPDKATSMTTRFVPLVTNGRGERAQLLSRLAMIDRLLQQLDEAIKDLQRALVAPEQTWVK